MPSGVDKRKLFSTELYALRKMFGIFPCWGLLSVARDLERGSIPQGGWGNFRDVVVRG